MKKLTVLFVLILLCQTTFAEENSKPIFLINSGITLPSAPEDFTDYWNLGFNIGGGYGFTVTPSVTILAQLNYSRLGVDKNSLIRDAGLSGYSVIIKGGTVSLISLTANLKAKINNPKSKIFPYFIGGIGFFRGSTSDATITAQGYSESVNGNAESAFSINFGVGLDFFLSPKSDFFIESRYNIAFTENESMQFLPINFGVSFK